MRTGSHSPLMVGNISERKRTVRYADNFDWSPDRGIEDSIVFRHDLLNYLFVCLSNSDG